MPSMSRADRPPKWRRRPTSLAGHSGLRQRMATSASSVLPTSPAHTGQATGMVGSGRSRSASPGTRATTLGMTSPPFSMKTRWPTRSPRRASSSTLCSVARRTVEPATSTASSSATGVSFPLRPTCQVMPSTVVVTWVAGNLKAMAQRGTRSVVPTAAWVAGSSTLSTTPSVSKGRRRRSSAWAAIKRSMSSMAPTAVPGMRAKPQVASRAMAVS